MDLSSPSKRLSISPRKAGGSVGAPAEAPLEGDEADAPLRGGADSARSGWGDGAAVAEVGDTESAVTGELRSPDLHATNMQAATAKRRTQTNAGSRWVMTLSSAAKS